ncbi:DivIVA domain-containing protein, partial [Algiphilus sp. NNCM1]|nr:DivIVA domain-containing protein [Algiphilus acroporae]
TVANVIFTQRKGKRGYDERQVDYYLNECVQLLTRLESYARVADFVGEPSESAMTAANPSATSLASQETQVVSPLFAVPAVSAEPIAQPAQVQNSTDSFDALNKAEREIFTTPATSPVSIPATQTAAPTYAPVVPPVFQPTISTPSAPVTPAAPVTPEPQAAPVAPAAPEQSLAHLFKASNAVDEEPSSAGTETEAFNPLSDDGAPSYDAPAAPAAPVIPDTSVAHQPEESHGINI